MWSHKILVGFSIVCGIALLSLMRLQSSIDVPSSSPSVVHFTRSSICPTKTKDELKADLKSQSEEDTVLLRWFNGLCGGTYIEMGALNGMAYSNSYVFNKQFNWKGLLIEPSTSNYKELVRNRPDELALVQAAVCKTEENVHYVDKFAVGGIWEFSAPSFREHWWQNITLESPQVQKIRCQPLRTIFHEHVPDISYFDFFSLDVEGAELMVLQSIDFDKVGFGIIFIEASGHNLRKNLAVRSLLFSKGYYFLQLERGSEYFVNKDYATIYKSVL